MRDPIIGQINDLLRAANASHIIAFPCGESCGDLLVIENPDCAERQRASAIDARLCEVLGILGADEHDLGPTLARQRMDELHQQQQRASAAEAQRDALRTQVERLLADAWYAGRRSARDMPFMVATPSKLREKCDDELSALLVSVPGLTKKEKAECSLGNTVSCNADATSSPSESACPKCGYSPLSCKNGLCFCPQPPEGCGDFETRDGIPHRVAPPRL